MELRSTRKPRLLSRLSGVYLLRYAERQRSEKKFQLPPPGAPGASPMQHSSNQLPSRSDNLHHTSPGTTPTRSHACHITPTDSASYHQQHVSSRQRSRCTTRTRSARSHCRQSCTSWLPPPGTRTPTPPQSVAGKHSPQIALWPQSTIYGRTQRRHFSSPSQRGSACS